MRLVVALSALLLCVADAQDSNSSSIARPRTSCEQGDPVRLLSTASDSATVMSSNCTSTSLAVVTDDKKVRTLVAGGLGIARVDSVPAIDALDLTQNAVVTLSDLSSYASIKRLVLASNQLTSLKGITFPKTLAELDLSSNALPETTALGSLPSLTSLTINNVGLSDISTIALPPTLLSLSASFNKLTKFPASTSLSSLTTLILTTNSIKSFSDLTLPPSLVQLDLSWNALSSFDGFSLPKTVTKLFLGGNHFTSFANFKTTNELTTLYAHDNNLGNLEGVTIPDSVTALSFMNCNLTTLSNVKLPSKLVYLDISKNYLTDIPKSYPSATKQITANGNKLTQLSGITFSTSIMAMNFSGNSIAKVKGVIFPLVLDKLDFGAFPIDEFEIRRSDLTTIQKLTTLTATITQTSCANVAAQSVIVKGVSLCVIPDDVFAMQYGSASSSAVALDKGAKSSSTWVLPMLICLAVLIVIAVSVFIYRRRKAARNPKQPTMAQTPMPDLSQTLANPSVFSDLSHFSDRGKPTFSGTHQFNNQGAAASTINSFNTMFSKHNSPIDGGGGTTRGLLTNSHGPEASLLKYRIQTHEVTLQRALAHGGFGAVYLATYQMQDVVVKKILPEKASDDRCLQAFIDEIKLNATLSHPKIVRFIGVSWNTLADIAVLMEFMPNGDLDGLLKSVGRNPTNPDAFGWFSGDQLPSKSAIALDILDAVVYLHSFSSPIIHRDLKAKNVLLGHNYTAKLSDFGVSREWQVDATMTAGIGTMAWIAPEVLRGERYTEKADMYSFGVILTELATCAKPFEGISNALIVLKVTSGEHRPEMGDDCPDDIRELGMRCLSYDAGDRPSAMVAHYELKTLLKAHSAFEL